MAVLLGTDEAGYGPNLGPLVVSATLWRVPGEAADDLYTRLAQAVSRQWHAGSTLVPLADSKQLYHSGEGLAALEYGVYPALTALGGRTWGWRDVWARLAPESLPDMAALPWPGGDDVPLPVDAAPATLQALCHDFPRRLRDAGVELVEIRSAVLFPEKFNDQLDRAGSKGEVLSQTTLDLVQRLLESVGDEPILVCCDKHGGRSHYVPLLQPRFPEHLVEVRREGRAESVYRWGPAGRRVEARFTAKGESFLPAALASMVAKYLRELAMRAFNRFWQQQLPGLRPTAGYPVDARRFFREIEPVRRRLSIPDRLIWRQR
jgi:ribonuclease HII